MFTRFCNDVDILYDLHKKLKKKKTNLYIIVISLIVVGTIKNILCCKISLDNIQWNEVYASALYEYKYAYSNIKKVRNTRF